MLLPSDKYKAYLVAHKEFKDNASADDNEHGSATFNLLYNSTSKYVHQAFSVDGINKGNYRLNVYCQAIIFQ